MTDGWGIFWQYSWKITATFLLCMGVHQNHMKSYYKIHMLRPLQIKSNLYLEGIYLSLIGMYAAES